MKPGSCELSEKLEALLVEGVNEKAFSHAALAWGNLSNKTRTIVSVNADRSSIFDLASMSKALSTGFLLCSLLQQNDLSVDLSVAEICDHLGITHNLSYKVSQQVVKNLLGHRSEFPAWGCLWINKLGLVDNLWGNRELSIESHLSRIMDERPEQEACYSDLGYILCGYLIELISNKDQSAVFGDLVSSHCDGVIGYSPKSNPAFSQSHIVSTGHCAVRGRELVGEVHDENCASLGGVSGHAGLFGSIDGVVDCLELLFEEEKFFSKNQKLILTSRSNDGLLGLRQNSQNSVKPYADGKAMGHLGFTGTSFYINPETADFIVFLTNRVYHGRLNQKIAKYRKQTHSIIQEFQSNRP